MRVNIGAGARRGCGVSTLEILKTQVGKTLSNLLYLDRLGTGVGRETLRSPTKPVLSDDLTLVDPCCLFPITTFSLV